MIRKKFISFALLLATGGATQAQERKQPEAEATVITSRQADAIACDMSFSNPVPSSTTWLREEVDPIAHERRKIRRMQEQIAQQSITKHTSTSGNEIEKSDRLWKISIGNTATANWSPYPDRQLDARTLSFPTRQPDLKKQPSKK